MAHKIDHVRKIKCFNMPLLVKAEEEGGDLDIVEIEASGNITGIITDRAYTEILIAFREALSEDGEGVL